MVKIVFGTAGAEGLGNIAIDEQFGRLENGCQFTDTVTQMADSHKAYPVSEDRCLESYLQRDATYYTQDVEAGGEAPRRKGNVVGSVTKNPLHSLYSGRPKACDL